MSGIRQLFREVECSWSRYRAMWREEGTQIAIRVALGKARMLFLRDVLRRRLVKRFVSAIGAPMYVDLTDPGFSRTIFYRGVHEPLATEIVKRELMPGMTAIDIGANMGYYTLSEAQLVGDEGLVLAIEPVPTTFSILRKNVELNQLRNVRLFQVAIGDHDGIAEMYVTEKLNWSHLNHGMHHSSRAEDIQKSLRQVIKVPIQTLDSFVTMHQISTVNFLRMDVEGYEIAVFQGGWNTIADQSAHHLFKMFVEVHPFLVEDRMPFSQLVQSLASCGLRTKSIAYHGEIIAEWPPMEEVTEFLCQEEFREAPHLLFSNERGG